MSIHDGRDDDSVSMNAQPLCDWCDEPAIIRVVHPLDARFVEPACRVHDYSERVGAKTQPI